MTEPSHSLDDLRIDHSASGPGRRLWPWLVLLLVVVGAVVAYWLWRSSSIAEVTTATVREELASGDSDRRAAVLDASGYVVARRQATVSSKVTGRLTEVLVEEGLEVAEGQVLARLDDSLVSRQLALSEAQLEAARKDVTEVEVRLAEAEITLGRTRELVAADVATAARLDADQAARDSLDARLAAARQNVEVAARSAALRRQELEDTVIRAPFAGVAISKDAQPGEMVSPVSAGGGFTRTGISTLVDMSSLEIEVDVNEAYINRVTAGQPATAVLDAYPDWRIPARVITPVPTADRDKATVRVRIGFDQLDPRILPDMGVKVTFLEERPPSEAAPRALLIVPADAVRRDGGRDVVFVVRDGRVERRAVALAPRAAGAAGEEAELLSGVSIGERVVVDGPEELTDGQRVRVDDGS